MDIEQRTAALTTAYIHSYNLALKEVKNPNLAAQIATAVIMVIDLNAPKQSVNPLELLFAQMATAAQQQREESEENNHDRTEQKMQKINAWVQRVNKNSLEVQDKLVIAGATMEMLEKLEPIYDKYNPEGGGKKPWRTR